MSIVILLATNGKVLSFWLTCGHVGIEILNIVINSHVLQSLRAKGLAPSLLDTGYLEDISSSHISLTQGV